MSNILKNVEEKSTLFGKSVTENSTEIHSLIETPTLVKYIAQYILLLAVNIHCRNRIEFQKNNSPRKIMPLTTHITR